MTSAWMLMWRDVVAARGRLVLVGTALAVSIAAVVTMLTTWTVLRREVPHSYLASNPASALLSVADSIPRAALDAVRRVPNVAAAEPSASLLARVEVGAGEWLPIRLFVVPTFDAQRIATLHPDAGRWPAAPGTIQIERSALSLLAAGVGGSVTIDLPDVGRRQLTIGATVHDPGVAPAWQEQLVYGYVTTATLARLGHAPPLDVLKLVVREGGADPVRIERTARAVAQVLAAHAVDVQQVRIPAPQQHPHQRQMNAVIAMLLAFSLLVLLLGAILTSGVIGGWLAQQQHDIAILKAIGASRVQVGTRYVVVVAVLGTVAALVGLPAGLLIGRQFIRLVATLLNLRLESLAVPWWLPALAALLGVGAPMLAAAIPIARAARRTVRAMLDADAARPDAARPNGVVRQLARWRIPDPAVTLALRNAVRRRGRLVMTTVLLAGAGAMCMASLDLRAAWNGAVDEAARDRRFQLEVWLSSRADERAVLAAVRAVRGVATVESWGSTHAARTDEDGLEVAQAESDGMHGGVTLRAAPPGTSLIAHRMSGGRWLAGADDRDIVVNSMARAIAFRDVRIGDSVALRISRRRVMVRLVGVLREPLTAPAIFAPPTVVATAAGTASTTNAVRVRLADPSHATTVANALTAALTDAGMPVRAVVSENRFATAQRGHVFILVFALGFIAVVMAVVGLLGLASSLGVSVLERTREFGVMRAVGCSTSAVLRMVVVEGLLIAALSLGVAVAASRMLSLTVGRVLASISAQELTLALSPGGVAWWALGLFVGTVLVSVVPALRASRLTVRDALVHL